MNGRTLQALALALNEYIFKVSMLEQLTQQSEHSLKAEFKFFFAHFQQKDVNNLTVTLDETRRD